MEHGTHDPHSNQAACCVAVKAPDPVEGPGLVRASRHGLSVEASGRDPDTIWRSRTP